MILLYSEEITPRLEYIVRLIFTQILKTEVSITDNSAKFKQSELPKINYSYEKFDDEFYIKPHRLLFLKALITPNINPVWINGDKYFCESSKDSVFPFDPFAASFYVVTRYEEYLEKDFDKLGRYSAQNSILSKYNLLKKPVVNIWAQLIAAKLKERFPELQFTANSFNFITSVDIDNAWAYSNKGFWRTSGALVKCLIQGKKQEYRERRKVLAGQTRDPYDTYEYLDNIFKDQNKQVMYFISLGDYGKYDKNISYKNPKYRKLITQIKSKYEVGLHPSYATAGKGGRKKLSVEKQRLDSILGSSVTKSRQHFLQLRFPKTYRRLIKAGITSDYTMGYSNATGFRAGICTPYYFYDLKKEQTTNLLLTPFQVMDATLRHYLRMNPETAWEEIRGLMEEVRNVGGTFVSIWHNETVNDQRIWEGYREVFEKMYQLGVEWSKIE